MARYFLGAELERFKVGTIDRPPSLAETTEALDWLLAATDPLLDPTSVDAYDAAAHHAAAKRAREAVAAFRATRAGGKGGTAGTAGSGR